MVFTDKQISEYKKKFGTDLHLIEVPDGEETYSCILRAPTRQDLSYAATAKDPMKMSEVMIASLWVAGDEVIKERDDLFLAVVPALEQVLKVKEATVKKL